MLVNLESVKSVLFNLPGWHTKKKLVVFESDDWGSIRIPSRSDYDYFEKLGFRMAESPYCLDSLESNVDITNLLEVLGSFKSKSGGKPIFTINSIVANPDFEKIRENYFEEYYYEPFTSTYERYPNHDKSFKYLEQGIHDDLFKPQLHGREHINTEKWIRLLKEGNAQILGFFDRFMYGLPDSVLNEDKILLQRVFSNGNADSKNHCSILSDAVTLFRKIWGYTPRSFIAPNYFWDIAVENCLFMNDIKYLQGQRAQFLAKSGEIYQAKYHFTGQRSKSGLMYLIRNCYFEPSFKYKKDWVSSCINEIFTSFQFHKPAIIGTHRVNYIGGIDEKNREHGLKELSTLLKTIIHNWPDVEFISSDQLGDIIAAN
jgi:hypothetical protein